MTPAPLPMFPLGTVLVPHAVLPLHIFEPRYRVLMFDCLRGDREFGVVLIERGHEAGGGDQRFGVATVGRIVEAVELPDGRWLLNAVGTRRVRVVAWLPDDPYPRAMVETVAELPWSPGADAAQREAEAAVGEAVALAIRLAARLGADVTETGDPVPEPEVAEPGVAAWRLIAAAPLGALDKQQLLEMNDPASRLQRLAGMAHDQASLLAYRLNDE